MRSLTKVGGIGVTLKARAGEVAQELGIGVQTLHFYERKGLIPPPARSDSGYRLYSRELVDRVVFIRKAQALGLPLQEIKDVLTLVEHGACPCGRVKQGLEQKLTDIDERLAELKEFRRELSSLIEANSVLDPQAGQSVICSIVEGAAHRVSAPPRAGTFAGRSKVRDRLMP